MDQPQPTIDEANRLNALLELNLLDTFPEEQFDHMTRFVQAYFNVSICLVSLVDKNRQWFKSKQGLEACETGRAESFCGHAIHSSDVFVVEDTLEDQRFADNPLVLDGPKIRFYAGFPLQTAGGHRIGTLCIIDTKPRQFNYSDKQHLQDFGKVIESLIRQRSAEIATDKQSSFTQRLISLLTKPSPLWTRRAVAFSISLIVLASSLFLAVQTDNQHVISQADIIEHLTPDESTNDSWWHYTLYIFVGGCLAMLMYFLLRLPANLRKMLHILSVNQVRNERRFRDAIEALADGFIIFDNQQKVAVYNQNFISLYPELADIVHEGISYQELRKNSTVRSLVKQPDFLDVDDLRKQQPERIIEFNDGRWIKMVERPMRDGGIVGFHTDITELKRKELQLIEARQKAETANVVKSKFLANVSHEVRTPLNGIIGLLDVLVDDEELNSQQQFYLTTMQDSSNSLLQILNDILDVSKMEAGKLTLVSEPFNLTTTLQSACSLMNTNAEASGLSLSLSLPEQELSLLGDPGRIRQLVLNLLSNSIKFTKVGSINLTATYDVVSDTQVSVTITITDTGIGIPETMVNHILEPFTQVDNSAIKHSSGTGLGLAISNNLVKLMQGTLTINSQEQSGTEIIIGIPFTLAKPVEYNSATLISNLNLRDRNVKILLADDDKTNQLVMQAMCDKLQCNIDIVNDGIEAVEAAKKLKYDVILMDIYMPRMDGITASTLIRADSLCKKTPIIAFTANAMEGDKKRFMDAGMDDYVSKPINKVHFLQTLSKFLQ
ncbi:ATP-binding protein [uncultured Shewanella sp.]|uniref:ATP-binding protein n=1 Tax=uncultured Shewanella sp. TaxID=173975 RepID=UPI0037041A62